VQVLTAVEPYVIFKREHVRRALGLLPRLDGVRDPVLFLQLAHEVDDFAHLNYSKSKRIFAADVEQHLRSMGVLCPCNDFPASHSGGMVLAVADRRVLDPSAYHEHHDTPAPRNGVKV